MNQAELMKDWYVRYNFIVGSRQTPKQKSRFISSLLSDLEKMNVKASVHEFGSDNQGKNVYVGDITNAKKIISTYYDTPVFQNRSYFLKDTDLNKKNTIKTIIFQNSLLLILGVVVAFFIAIPVYQTNAFLSGPAITVTVFFLIYFILLKKISVGWPTKKNLIRNTSSLLVLLKSLKECRDEETAFAFLDFGAYNQAGLKELRENTNASIYYLDSVGAEKPLVQISTDTNLFVSESPVQKVNERILELKKTLFLTSMEKKGVEYYLSRDSLKQKELNGKNMEQAFEFLKKVEEK